VRMADQTGNMHAAGLEVDDEPDDVADEAVNVRTSTVKKSVVAITRCGRRWSRC
jgi:hypothetical protein